MKKPSEWLGTAKKVSSDYKLSINNFSGVTANCIKECVKPSNPPIHFILYVGTNILISNQTSEEISTYIINLALLMKGESQLYSGLMISESIRKDMK